MTRTPAVAVVLCVLNGMPLLQKQLDALAVQDWDGDWELLLVDNGCTDGSVAAAGASGVSGRLRVVDARDRPGLAHARNVGAEHTQARWLMFCDADDEVAPDWVRRGAECLQSHDFFGGMLRIDRINTPDVQESRTAPTPGGLPVCLEFRPYAVGANFGVAREAYLAVQGCDERFLRCGDDVDLSWRLQDQGVVPHWCPGAVVDYRLRNDPEALWRQQFNYAASCALLYAKNRAAGCPRPNARQVLREWGFLATHPHLARRDDDALAFARQMAAVRLGSLSGAWHHRVLFW